MLFWCPAFVRMLTVIKVMTSWYRLMTLLTRQNQANFSQNLMESSFDNCQKIEMFFSAITMCAMYAVAGVGSEGAEEVWKEDLTGAGEEPQGEH